MRQHRSEYDPGANDDRASNGEASAPGGAESLYHWWFSALPTFFGIDGARMAATAAGTPADDGRTASAEPARTLFPVDRIADSLALTGELLNAFYAHYLRALAAGRADDAVGAFEQLVQGQIKALRARFTRYAEAAPVAAQRAAPGVASLGPSLQGLTANAGRINPLAEMLQPLALNVDRAYGGLFDALGLGSLREFQSALREMARAGVDHQRAQAGYLEAVSGALVKGGESVLSRLSEMRDQGESVDTLAALVRLWAQSTDQAMHAAMQSPRALESSAAVVRAAARWRQEQQRAVAVASSALNVPTRAELDEAYREIQDLKRELRRLRKSGVHADDEVRPAAPARRTPSQRAPAATRRTGAARGAGRRR